MSILIKGMEMPHQGEFSHVRIYDNGDVTVEVGTGKEVYEAVIAHAVQLPPHGRLIDADALEEEAQKRLLICNKNDNQFEKPYEVMRAIVFAPTIIPAEEGE